MNVRVKVVLIIIAVWLAMAALGYVIHLLNKYSPYAFPIIWFSVFSFMGYKLLMLFFKEREKENAERHEKVYSTKKP